MRTTLAHAYKCSVRVRNLDRVGDFTNPEFPQPRLNLFGVILLGQPRGHVRRIPPSVRHTVITKQTRDPRLYVRGSCNPRPMVATSVIVSFETAFAQARQNLWATPSAPQRSQAFAKGGAETFGGRYLTSQPPVLRLFRICVASHSLVVFR